MANDNRPGLTPWKWVLRGIGGLFLGYFGSCVAMACWLGLGAAICGNIQAASDSLQPYPKGLIILLAVAGSMGAGFFGGLLGSLVVGAASLRRVLAGSASGVIVAAVLGAVTAAIMSVACLASGLDVRDVTGWIIILSTLTGPPCGWIGGWIARGAYTPSGSSASSFR